MEKVDVIIAGAGAAGLSLLKALQDSPLKDKKIILLDPQVKDKNDRTWCFWSQTLPQGLNATPVTQWKDLRFIGIGFEANFSLAPYTYTMVQGIDFYREQLKLLNASSVRFIQGAVDSVQDTDHGVNVSGDGFELEAQWFFDSRPPVFQPQPECYHYLKQHFMGWVIETEESVFDPTQPVLFDFRTPQDEGMAFMYILPFSSTEALVEYTLFSEDLLNEAQYTQGIKDYLQDVLQLKSYRIHHVEQGVIPMTDHPLPRRLGNHHMAIGTRGGLVKPSSGYAFLRILKDSERIVQSLLKEGHPFFKENKPARYALFDSIMLQVIKSRPQEMATIFTVLFKDNRIQSIFKFLDEENTLLGDLRLISSLPWLPFLTALWRIKILKKI